MFHFVPRFQPSLRDFSGSLKRTQHCVLGYFQPSAFGGLGFPTR